MAEQKKPWMEPGPRPLATEDAHGSVQEDDGFNDRRATVLLNTRSARMVAFVKRVRELRGGYFDPSLFGEPGWDILLDLYEADLSFRELSINAVCVGARVPPTTGLRWLAALQSKGYVARRDDPMDARRKFVLLTDTGARAMAALFDAFENELVRLQPPRTDR